MRVQEIKSSIMSCLADRFCWTLVVIALTALSCSADQADDDREEMLVVMRQEIVEALPEASPTQQEILADLHVSPGEADRAAAEVVECASSQGVTVTPIWKSTGMHFSVSGPTSEIAHANHKIYESCQQSFFWLTANVLALQNSLSSEEIERRDGLVLDCLVAAGFDVGSWPDVQSEPDPSVEADCVDSAMNKLGLS